MGMMSDDPSTKLQEMEDSFRHIKESISLNLQVQVTINVAGLSTVIRNINIVSAQTLTEIRNLRTFIYLSLKPL